jgi:CheY-like chemotaxis protein
VSTVLIVDDDLGSRLYLRSVLEGSGYEVIDAPDGKAALDILQTDSLPDIVATDLSMPILDGGRLIVRLKAEPRTADIPIVIVSGDYDAAIALHKSWDVAAVVNKPVDPILLALCLSAIANRAGESSLTIGGDH